jgi:quinol-cytochrome oxidoreductase complex cytochrome b subunit
MVSNDEKKVLVRSIWHSVFRGPIYPRNDRERKWVVLNNLILHFRPTSLPAKTLKYTHTFGLGGMSLVLVTVLFATGILLMFAYEPSPERAYESIVSLQDDVLFGKLIRNIHHWSANFLIVIVLFHLLRVYFTGAYHAPRQFNWLIGLSLLACIVVSNFTGYLMPWDQLSYWAITISTGMIGYIPGVGVWLQELVRGGPEIGSATLVIFYTLHTTVVPVLLVVLMAFHFWRVRKAHGVVIPHAADEEPEKAPEYVLTLPNLLLRELVVACILIAFIMVISVLFNAPLGDAANPGMSPNPAKAPWYFLGLQELLLHFHPLFAVVIIPLVASVALVFIPYYRYDTSMAGAWFLSHKGRRVGTLAAVVAAVATPILILADEFWLDMTGWAPGIPSVVRSGLLPTLVIGAALVSFYVFLKRKHGASNNEAIQAMFILLTVVLAILTGIGVWFRGPGMALMWPWSL